LAVCMSRTNGPTRSVAASTPPSGEITMSKLPTSERSFRVTTTAISSRRSRSGSSPVVSVSIQAIRSGFAAGTLSAPRSRCLPQWARGPSRGTVPCGHRFAHWAGQKHTGSTPDGYDRTRGPERRPWPRGRAPGRSHRRVERHPSEGGRMKMPTLATRSSCEDCGITGVAGDIPDGAPASTPQLLELLADRGDMEAYSTVLARYQLGDTLLPWEHHHRAVEPVSQIDPEDVPTCHGWPMRAAPG